MSSPRVRVLQVAPSLGLGGTEKVMQLFACHLDRSRFDVAVYSPTDGPRGPLLRQAGITTYIQPDIDRALAHFRPHIAHLHRAGWPQPVPLRNIRGARVPVVVETNVFGRHDPSPLGAAIDKHLFVSHFCARRYQAQHGIDVSAPSYGVLYNPVDTDFFAAACPPDRNIPANIVGRISRPDPGKWSTLALDFLPHALAAVPDLRYRIIGGYPEAEAQVREQGWPKSVEFLPPVLTDGELAQFLNGLTLLAHANDTGESFGLVIAEAMAAGLPVVTHPSPPPRDNAQVELVDHGVTGFVAATPQAYAEAVVHLLTHPVQARAMGEAGREKARNLFRAQTIAARLAEIYTELLQGKGIAA